MGKRGGVRVAYYFVVRSQIVYWLDIYAKNEKSDLTPAESANSAPLVRLWMKDDRVEREPYEENS